MTTLTKSDRLVAIERILKKTFEPRFDELRRLLTEAVTKLRDEKYPKFLSLYTDPEISPYLNVYGVRGGESVGTGSDDWSYQLYKEPVYGRVAADYLTQQPKRGDNSGTDLHVNVPHTGHMRGIFTVPGLVPLHDETWDDLIRAASKLRETFFAYKNREAFTKDFPALAEYLPTKVTVSSSTAVRLNPVDVMKSLATMGIPPETKDEPACAEG